MSTAVKWIVAVLVIAALAWALWWSGWLTKKPVSSNTQLGQQATTTQEQQPLNGMSANNDSSDAAVAQDSAAIDTQLQAYTTDTTNVDSSMNDKAISQ